MAKNNLKDNALIFAALADETRLGLVQRLASGEELSISQLADGLNMSRQGVTKHLHVLEDAGLVKNKKSGRESRFQLDTKPLEDAMDVIKSVERRWDQRLARLKIYAENTK